MTGGGTRLPVVGDIQPGSDPPFHRIAIIGLGAVGGSLALALRRAWPRSLVIGVDAHAVIETAIGVHAIDVGAGDLMIAGDAELVVLAGGAGENARVLPFLADAIGGAAVVLCLSGSEEVERASRALPGRLPVVLGLPDVAVQGSGIRDARPELFRGTSWAVTPVTASDATVARVQDVIRAVGGSPVARSERPGGAAGGTRSA